MTNTETIRELSRTVSTLEERLDNARAEIERFEAERLPMTVSKLEERLDNARDEIRRLDAERSKTAESLIEAGRKQAVLEENVKELKKLLEEKDRRRWAIVLAVVGCLLSLAANIVLTYIKLSK